MYTGVGPSSNLFVGDLNPVSVFIIPCVPENEGWLYWNNRFPLTDKVAEGKTSVAAVIDNLFPT